MTSTAAGAPEPAADGEFDADTALGQVDGRWVGRIDPRWNVGMNPNGGYTLAIAARAMLEATGRPDPLTLTAHYVAPPAAGPVGVHTEIVRAGRRYATVEGRLVQDGRELVRVLGATGDLSAQEGLTRVAGVMPSIPPPEACIDMLRMSGERNRTIPEVMHRYDLLLDPACEWVRSRAAPTAPTVTDDPSGGPLTPLEVAGWIRFADGTAPSVLGLLAMADAFPPTLIGSAKVGWIPTVELTVHIRARPAPGWVLGVSRTRFLVDGLLEQDGELWDSGGSLVALCRQMALVMPPR